MSFITRRCSVCKLVLQLCYFAPADRKKGRPSWKIRCRPCRKRERVRYMSNPKTRLLFCSKKNAVSKGVPHSIKADDLDLPEFCKYLGLKLDYRPVAERSGRSPNLPSVDRIDPSLGYVPGNVQVISDLANRMKQDATIEQLLAFAKGVIEVHGELGRKGNVQNGISHHRLQSGLLRR